VVEGIHGRVKIVEEDETDKGVREIGVAVRECLAELRGIDKAGHIIEYGGTKESFDEFKHKGAAVGAGDAEIALKEEQEIAKGTDHEAGDSWRK
jgi:hypothetical protein